MVSTFVITVECFSTSLARPGSVTRTGPVTSSRITLYASRFPDHAPHEAIFFHLLLASQSGGRQENIQFLLLRQPRQPVLH